MQPATVTHSVCSLVPWRKDLPSTVTLTHNCIEDEKTCKLLCFLALNDGEFLEGCCSEGGSEIFMRVKCVCGKLSLCTHKIMSSSPRKTFSQCKAVEDLLPNMWNIEQIRAVHSIGLNEGPVAHMIASSIKNHFRSPINHV